MEYQIKQSNPKSKSPSWWIQIAIVTLTAAAVGITAFLGIQTYRTTRHTALEQFNQHQLMLARSAAAGIETYFREVKASLVSATKVNAIRDMTEDSLEYMQNMYIGFIPRTSIRRLDENGVLRFIYPSDEWRSELIGKDYSGELYFKSAQEMENVVLSGIITNEIGEKRIRMSAPIYRHGNKGGQKEFKGILIVSFDLKAISDIFISPIKSGESGYAWLMDQNGYFLAHNVDAFVGQDAFRIRETTNPELSYISINEIQQKVMVGSEGVGRYLSGWHRGSRGRIEKLIAYSPIRIMDKKWSVAVVAPINEVDKIIRKAGSQALQTFTFIILFLIFGGLFSSLSVYRWSNILRSEVRRRTKDLKETMDYLNNLISCANAPIVVLNERGLVTIFNDTFERISGRKKEEVIGDSLAILFPEATRFDSLRKLDLAQKEGMDLHAEEMAIQHIEGKIRIQLWNSANIYSETKNDLMATIIHGEDVTDRKKAEEELKKSEECYRTVVEHQADLICRYTPDWRFTFVNEAYCRYLEKSREDLIGNSFIPLISEEDKGEVAELLGKIRDKHVGESTRVHQLVDSNGGITWLQWVNQGIFNEEGELIEYQSVGRDITELKKAEKALQDSEAQHRAFFEGAPDPIFLADIETGLLIDANPAASQLMMMPREAIIDMNHLDLYPEEIRDTVREGFGRVIREGEKRVVERLVRRRDEVMVPVEILAQVMTINGRGVIQGIFRDVTERKKAEKKLRENEEQFRKIFEGGALGMAFLDLDYRFQRVNVTLCSMLGYEEIELRGLTFVDITHPDSVETDLEKVADLLRGKIPYYKTEKRYIRKDSGILWASVTASIIYDENRSPLYFISMIEDITDRKQAEEEKAHLEAQLLHAQKMEALGTLVAGVAHEINNPINKIMFDIPLLQKIWSDVIPILEEQVDKNPDKKYGGLTCDFIKENLPQLMSDIEMATKRVVRTVNNLKSFTKRSSITDKSEMELNTAVHNALRLIETTLKKSNISLELNLTKKSPMIEGNLQSIEQIIMNIAINAIQAIDHSGGIIRITTKLQRKNRRAFISISDNGNGVDQAIIGKLFDPFVTTRQAEGGTGLGLPITYNLVEAHGGEIAFTSKKGVGTTFTITFPSIGK